MVVSRTDLKELIRTGEIVISPLNIDHIGPVGLDLTIGDRALDPDKNVEINIKDTPLHPGQFVLINSKEYLEIPNYLIGKLVSRSSVARLGLMVGLNADLVEPRFRGKVTFAIKNISNSEIWLKEGLRIAQLVLEEISEPEEDDKSARYDYKNPQKSDLCKEMVN